MIVLVLLVTFVVWMAWAGRRRPAAAPPPPRPCLVACARCGRPRRQDRRCCSACGTEGFRVWVPPAL
jgi:hypothetical protein